MVHDKLLKDMVWVPGGSFLMGSEDFYPEESPVHRVSVSGFWMDEHAVTVAEYRRFVRATGYMTIAERQPDPAQYSGVAPELLVPGSLVFDQPAGPSTSAIRATGGHGFLARSGGTRRGRRAHCTAGSGTR